MLLEELQHCPLVSSSFYLLFVFQAVCVYGKYRRHNILPLHLCATLRLEFTCNNFCANSSLNNNFKQLARNNFAQVVRQILCQCSMLYLRCTIAESASTGFPLIRISIFTKSAGFIARFFIIKACISRAE